MNGKRTKKIDNRIAIAAADMEQNFNDAPDGKEVTERFTAPCSIHFHHIRKRLADIDGLSSKAVIDGLVHSKVLQDDSPKYVKEVLHTQEKSVDGTEWTIIAITELT